MSEVMFDKKWHKELQACGRNGGLQCHGIDIWEHKETLTLSPISSRGPSKACAIELPKEAVPELCKALQGADLIGMILDRLGKDLLPLLIRLHPVIDAELEKRIWDTNTGENQSV
jgi:hypothetical protein